MSMPWEDFSPPQQSGPWDDFKPQKSSPAPEQASAIPWKGINEAVDASQAPMAPIQPQGSNPATMALSAAGQTFGIQPNTASSPTGSALQTVGNQAMAPARLSNTLGQGSQPAADFTAEKLGGMGVNPYVSAATGMVAGMAADPRSWMPVEGVSKSSTGELPLKVAQAREVRTGVPARQFQALHKDPGAFFAGKNIERAGADIGMAKAAAGINPGVTSDLASLTPENLDRINPTKAIKIEDVNTVVSKLTNGQTPSAQEAQNALDSVNSIISQPSVQNNRDVFRQWTAIKTHINEALGQAAPDVRAANQAYARQKLGQAFSSTNAVNRSGTPSKLAMLAQQVPGALGGAVGGALFGPAGAAGGYEIGKMATSLYHAPVVAGLQTAIGGAANNAIGPLLSALEKMGTSPQAQALVARYLQGQNGNQR